MKMISKTFLKGLAALLPIGATVAVLLWLGTTSETLLGEWLRSILPEGKYVPGMSVVVIFAIILFVGVLMNAWIVRKLFRLGEARFERVPLVKTIYGSMKDLMGFFTKSSDDESGQVVMVKIGESARVLGLVTREDFSDLPDQIGTDETLAVYLPMSYQLGGYTLMVPRSSVEPVEMPVDAAMRFCVTAGMKKKEEGEPKGAAGGGGEASGEKKA